MNILPSGEQTEASFTAAATSDARSQHGSNIQGGQPQLNPNALSFQPGAVGASKAQRLNHSGNVAQANRQAGNGSSQSQANAQDKSGHGGLSKALGDRHSHSGRTDRGRNRSAVPPDGLPHTPLHNTEAAIVNVEQSPLGRSPSNRAYSSANHLLNFHSHHARDSRGYHDSRDGRGRGPHKKSAPRPLPYNRNKFLQANFRFLVSDAGNLRRHEADADLMLDWDDVVQVVVLATSEVQCPISLDRKPLCPQITPCGHVFAFHSIMQHLMTQGGEDLRKAAKCPLCYSMVAARELRLVQIQRVKAPTVDDTVHFVLLKRPRDSIIPAHVQSRPLQDQSASEVLGSDQASYSKQQQPSPAANAWDGGKSKSQSSTKDGKDHHKHGRRKEGKGSAVSREVDKAWNKYAKYTTVGDGKALWKAAAEELAAYAAQLTAEGGWDAAQEAPFLYAAMDALANRAGVWAERRQRLKLEGATEHAAAEMAEPAVAARNAVDFVKQFSTAAVHAAEEQQKASSKEAKHQELFPSLPSAAPVQAAQHGLSGGSRPKLTPLVRLPDKTEPHQAPAPKQASALPGAFAPAFSDDESDQPEAASDGAHGADSQTGCTIADAEDSASSRAVNVPEENSAATAAALSEDVAGTSPSARQPAAPPASVFFFYQAADGQCVFLHPLVSRVLLAHYGSYAACPSEVKGRVLEVEDLVQTDATRKRMKHLAHLPLSGAFKLAELDLTPLIPPAALASFAEEISSRQKRRERRAEHEAQVSEREAAAAAELALAAATKGLTANELKAMPLPSASMAALAGLNDEDALDAAIAQSLGLAGSSDGDSFVHGGGENGAALPPEAGVSFANIAKMGFAATGPKLSPGAPETGSANGQATNAWGPSLGGSNSSPAGKHSSQSTGAWGSSRGGTLASQLAVAESQSQADTNKDKAKAKKPVKQMVLLSTTQRRYT